MEDEEGTIVISEEDVEVKEYCVEDKDDDDDGNNEEEEEEEE